MSTPRPISFRAAPGRPCPVCTAESKGCSATDDGMHLCRAKPADATAWRQLSGMPDAQGFFHFRRTDDSNPGSALSTRKKKRQRDWHAKATEHAAAMQNKHFTELAARLRLPESAVRLYPLIGWCEASLVGTTFTIPEFDSTNRICGIMQRMPPTDQTHPVPRDEQKMMTGGNRGLMLPTAWRERGADLNPDLPLLIVEGASCTIAAAAAGLSAIGRPGSDAGREYLARILTDWPAERPIIVLGENDEKPGGKWPGREGAEKLAQGLANDLSREVHFALPPASAKDLRAWMISPDHDAPDSALAWPDRGAAFLTIIQSPDAPHRATYRPQATLERPRPEILVTTEEMAVNNEAISSLTRESNLYQRGGLLVRAIQSPASKTKSLDLPSSLRLAPFEKATLREVLSNTAIWKKEIRGAEDTATADTHPPTWCVDAVLARGTWAGIRNLVAVVDHPVVRPDGSVLSADGYDPDTELFVATGSTGKLSLPAVGADPSTTDAALPARLTIEDARRAVDVLTDAVVDFPFTEPSHRAAWIAALITPLCRFAFSGPAPLFLIDANCPGTGKGLLCDIISIIVSGTRFAIASYSHNEEEMRKNITAVAMAGDRLVLFDNLSGNFGNAAVDKALTGTIWKDRLLGETRIVTLPLFATWYATGNNVTLSGDIARRIIHSKLKSEVENPDEREDFVHPNLREWCWANRGKLLAAALAIPAAYIQAGSPKQPIPRFGSFEGWSDLVRSAMVWAGLPDPAANRLSIRRESDIEVDSMGYVLEKWATVDLAGCGLTASEFMERVFGRSRGENGPDEYAELRDVLRSMLRKLEPKDLGYKFRKYQGRIIGGRFLDSKRVRGVGLWFASSARITQTTIKVSNTLTHVEVSEIQKSNPSGAAMEPFSDCIDHCRASSPHSQTLENVASGAMVAHGGDTSSSHARETTPDGSGEKFPRAEKCHPSPPSPRIAAPGSSPAETGWLYITRRLDFLNIHAPDAGDIIREVPVNADGTAPPNRPSVLFYRLTPRTFVWFERRIEKFLESPAASASPAQRDEAVKGFQRIAEFAERWLDAGEVLAWRGRAEGEVELPAEGEIGAEKAA